MGTGCTSVELEVFAQISGFAEYGIFIKQSRIFDLIRHRAMQCQMSDVLLLEKG